MSCIFCDIVKKKIFVDLIFEDNKILAFKDLNPQAPIHILIIPKKHIESADEIKDEDKDVIGNIFLNAKNIAKTVGLVSGYRIVNNCGKDGGQSVNHLHFHLLGGRSLSWPPG